VSVAVRRGVVVVFVLIFIAMAMSMIGLVAVSMIVGAPPSIPSNATLYLPLRAPFPEVESFNVISQFVKRRPTLREAVEAIHKAKTDSRVKALVVTPAAEGALWGQLQEVRAALEDFRASGKTVTAFLEAAGAQEYYVASAADRIVLMPAGQLDLTGLATYELFFRGTLDKLGVRPDLLHIGDFKTASNTFTERGFTKAHLEMSQALNRDWYDEMVRAIAAGRKRSVEEIRTIIDNGPFLGDAAKQAGLVDRLAYADQLADDKPIAGTQRLDAETYYGALVPSGHRVPNARIALLYAAGTIASGSSTFDGAMGLVIGSDTFAEWLRKVRADPSVRAVVVRIDSPGGSAIASEVIWREMMLTRQKMPVIVSMGDVAASGGYYMAVPAHAIVAQPGTLTGSIGVVTGKFVLDGAAEKIGVGTGSVSDGKFAEMYSPFRAFTPAERARVEEQMQATYELFLSRVVEGRKSTRAKIDAVAQGRVWTGHQARERGLVDEIGGLDRAIQLAKEKAKLDVGANVDLVIYPQKPSFYDLLSNPFGSSAAVGLELLVPRPDARAIEATARAFQRFKRGESLLLMPNVFVR
jgi:protease-4